MRLEVDGVTPEMPSLREFMLPDMDSTFRIFAAHLRRVRTDWSYPLHTHPLFEVNLVLSGTQEMTVDGKLYTQREGDIMLLRPGMQHGSRAADGGAEGSRIGGARGADMTYYCLHFDVDDPGLRELLFRHANPFHAAEGRLSAAIRPTLDKLIGLSAADTAFGAGHKCACLRPSSSCSPDWRRRWRQTSRWRTLWPEHGTAPAAQAEATAVATGMAAAMAEMDAVVEGKAAAAATGAGSVTAAGI